MVLTLLLWIYCFICCLDIALSTILPTTREGFSFREEMEASVEAIEKQMHTPSCARNAGASSCPNMVFLSGARSANSVDCIVVQIRVKLH